MSQIFLPIKTTGRARGQTPRAWWVDAILIVAVAVGIYGVVVAAARWAAPLTPATHVDLSPLALPYYAGLSTLRMAIAYVISLAFTLVYARVALASRTAERMMLPLLDILQSIPILSFLPGVVLALVAIFPHNSIGLELAAILLIFTSQAWNMTFSFHQSLVTIPRELREAAAIYQLNWWQRFIRLEVPFGTIPLVWNSMMSWAGGWFFLMASEQFTLRDHSFELPGLGSYLATAASAGDIGALLLGLAALIAVIVLLDQLLWRPLIAWADRFKVEQTGSAAVPTSAVLQALRRSALLDWMRARVWAPASEALDRRMRLWYPPHDPERAPLPVAKPQAGWRGPRSAGEWVGAVALLLGAAVVVWGAIAALALLAQVSLANWGLIAASTGATLLRTTAALVLGVAWTVPVGVAIGMNPRLARRAQPIVQMVASIPATAIFPALLLLLLALPGGLDLAAVALMLLGTQWYVFFNVIAGAMAIPNDLREAAAIYKVRGWRRWRTLILPAIFPYLVTGMLTATGGAWNASIVSEYVTFNGHTVSTLGLGALIAASAGSNYGVLLAATLAMAAVVVAINRLVWKRLYGLAERRFHLD